MRLKFGKKFIYLLSYYSFVVKFVDVAECQPIQAIIQILTPIYFSANCAV